MTTRSRLRASDIEGYCLEGVDGNVLGYVRAFNLPGIDLVVRIEPVSDSTVDFKLLDWEHVLWVDPVKRTLLVSRDGEAALAVPADPKPSPARPSFRRQRAGIAALAVGVLASVSILVQANANNPKTPVWVLVVLAATAFGLGALLLAGYASRERPHLARGLRATQRGS